jgi:hypothetical protein
MALPASRFPTVGARATPASALVLGTLAVVGSAAIGFVGPTQPGLTLIGLALAVVVAVAMLVPTAWLPTAALLSILFVPAESLPVPALASSLPLGLLFLVVWQLRTTSSAEPRPIAIVVACAFAVWLGLSFAFAGMLSPRSVTWSVGALIAIVLFALRPPAAAETRLAIRAFTLTAAALAALAIVESFVVGSNPLLGPVFSSTTNWGTESTAIHRATTLIGHPLMNGTVFAVASVIVVTRLLLPGVHGRRGDYVQLALLVGGIAAAQTRTGALAALAGLLLAVVVSAQSGNRLRRLSFVGLGVVLLVFFGLALSQRNSSGLDFTVDHRASVPAAALASIDGHEVFGVGPSMSDRWRAAKRYAGTSVTLENGYAQLIVSIGPFGMLLFVTNLLVAIVIGLARPGSRPAAAGLATLALALAGFNAIEGSPRLLVLIAVLIATIYAHNPRRVHSSRSQPDPPA